MSIKQNGGVFGRNPTFNDVVIEGTITADLATAGALMDSELTNIAAVKALDQGVATTDSPEFAGIKLGGSGADNTISDFETGNWTPTFTGSSADPTSVSQFVDARYTKVGRAVHCVLHTYMSAFTGGSGDVRVALPFASNSGTKQSGAMGRRAGWTATAAPSAWDIQASASYLTLLTADSADARDNVNITNQYSTLTTYDEVYISFTYFTGS